MSASEMQVRQRAFPPFFARFNCVWSQPRLYYEGDVLAYNINQATDVYVFSTVNMNYRVCTLVGWLTKKDFMAKSTLIPAGSIRPNGVVFRKPSYVIGYKDVLPIGILNNVTVEG